MLFVRKNRTRMYRLFILSGFLVNLSGSIAAQDIVPAESQVTADPMPSTKPATQAAIHSPIRLPIKVEGAMLKTIDTTAVSAQVSGMLSDATLREGALVKKGQMLARIHDSAIRIKLDQLKLQMEISRRKKENTIDKQVATKNREVAETEYRRALSANERVPNTYPLNEVDRLKLVAERSRLEEERTVYNLQMAELDAEVTKTEYAQTEDLLIKHSIISPVEGMIVAVEKNLGEWVEPGMEIYRIVRTDKLRIEGLISVNSDDGSLIGRSARIELLRGDQRQFFFGKVVFISPDANPVNSLIRVHIEVGNSDRKLRPGLQVRVEIETEEPNKQPNEEAVVP